jgi:O-antigen ligase
MKIKNLDNKQVIILEAIFILWCLVLPWTTAGMQIVMVALMVLNIIFSAMNGQSPVKYHRFYLYAAVYLVTELISAFNSAHIKTSLIAVFNNDWVVLVVPFLVSLPIRAIWRKRAFQVLLLSVTLAGVYGIVQFFYGVDYIRGVSLVPFGKFFRAGGGYNFFLTYGGNQLFALAVAFAFMVSVREKKYEKGIYLFSFVIIFLSIIATFTRSSWIGSILIILLGTFIINKKIFGYTIGLLIISAVVFFIFIPDLQNRFFSIFELSKNEGRITLWKTSWEIFKHNVLFGIGHGNFNEYFEIYKVPGFYDATGHAHNDFINVAVLNGLVGLIAWTGLWVSWFYFAIKAYTKKVWEASDRYIILASILGIAGILLASLFQCYYTDLENNIFWWFLASTTLQIIVQSDKDKKQMQTS